MMAVPGIQTNQVETVKTMIKQLKFKPQDPQQPKKWNKTKTNNRFGPGEPVNPRASLVLTRSKSGDVMHCIPSQKWGDVFFPINFLETQIYRKRLAQIWLRAGKTMWIPRCSFNIFKFEILSFQKGENSMTLLEIGKFVKMGARGREGRVNGGKSRP